MIDLHSIPYLQVVQKRVSLPPGENKCGELAFLFTNNMEESINLTNNTVNCFGNNKYRYFYTPLKMVGYFANKKRYFVNKIRDYEKIKRTIQENTMLKMYPYKYGISAEDKKNLYYDLSPYLELLSKNPQSTVLNQLKIQFSLLKPILMGDYGKIKYQNGDIKDRDRFVLINAEDFPYSTSGKLINRIDNPVFAIYLALLKAPELVSNLDIDFFLFYERKILRFNPAKIEKKQLPTFLLLIRRLYSVVRPEATIPEIEKEIASEKEELGVKETTPKPNEADKGEEIVSSVKKEVIKQPTPPGVSKSLQAVMVSMSDSPKEIKDKMNEKRKEAISIVKKDIADSKKEAEKNDEPIEEPTQEEIAEKIAEKTDEEIENDEELLKQIYEEMRKKNAPDAQKSRRSTARDELLKEQQKDLVVKGLTLEQLSKIDAKKKEIEKNDVSTAIKADNPNMKEIQFQNFNKTYVEEVMPKDIVEVFENLNTASVKMFIRKIDVEDTSDVTNLKETWTVSLEDENRGRHTIKVDIPKFYDKNFLWLSGNKKNIKNQLFFLPVVKIDEDTVMIVTNYNKLTIKRVNARSLRLVNAISKQVDTNPNFAKYFKMGSCKKDNEEYLTGIEYDEFAAKYVKFKNNHLTIFFNQKEAQMIATAKNISLSDKEKIFIGFERTTPLFLDFKTQRDGFNRSISDIILENTSEESKDGMNLLNVPKRLMYTQITTMKQDQPMAILMCLWEGLSKVLEKAGIKYRLVNKKKDVKSNEDYIVFNNCILAYEGTVDAEILLNGLKTLDTKSYNISDFDTTTPYLPYIEKKYGKLSILNALENVYEFTIGGVEKEILLNQGLPTDLVQLMVYANQLLCDKQHISELDASQYRVRCAEVIPAILYDCIAKAYVPFKNSNGTKKLQIPQDAVIKKLLALTTVEEVSTLNPFLELETTHGVSTKGWRGVNLEDSYTVPKRCYDKSMTGIIGISSSPDANVGINRTLTFEPTIESTRGYINVKSDNLDELKDVNLFAPGEMMIPLGATRDDTLRTGHSVKQSRATIPIKGGSPVLISNGSDELCKYYLSSDFVSVAEEDGTVIEIDEKAEIMIVEYKSGKHKAINLGKNIVKNGGGGFELSNRLITDLKVGEKFKKNETIAWHKDFFKKIPTQGVRMNVGARIKVALYSSFNTYEDADFITERVSDLCSTEMCFRVKCSIGKNSNVFKMVKVGDEVAVGDNLIEFDESFQESEINQLLSSLDSNSELKEAVLSNSRNSKKSKYSGVVEEIKIYSASELVDLSPSLQKIVGNYYKRIDSKYKILDKYDKEGKVVKCGLLMTESSGKTEPDRYGNIRGIKVDDGVAIEFYIKHSEPLEVGSKVANYSPLKNIVSEIIPAGYEPVSQFRRDEVIDSIINPSSILNRMVASLFPTMFGNKVIIELKEYLRRIWLSGKEFSVKRKEMEDIIYKVFSKLDKTGGNTKYYKSMFQPMSDLKFKQFFTEFFENEEHFLILTVVDYERDIQMEDIEAAAKVINVPLYEYVEFKHYTMDKEHPTVTKYPIPVGYIHLKRPQQTVMKKNGMSITSEQRSAFTGQVTGADKNGRESDLENCMLTSLGMKHTLKELNGPRADDLVMKKEMLQMISEKGYLQLSELTDDIENKTTLNTINTYFLGMGLHTDLVTKGLKLPYVRDKE